MTAPVDVVVVSGKPLWPAHDGGRIRTARIVEELARRMRVLTLAPIEASPPERVRLEPLPHEAPARRAAAVASPRPRLGRALLGPRRLAVLRSVLEQERPGAVLFASSYLAAMAPSLDVPVVVDFADVELRRMASFARLRGAPLRGRGAAAFECLKARRWEPGVARGATLVATPSADDLVLLAGWGATAVHVPHGADRYEVTPSPAAGPVTFVASFGYHPNAEAAQFVLSSLWPLLQRAEPGLRLRVVGRDAGRVVRTTAPASVEVFSDLEDVDSFYREASVVLAPVRAGGGCQLKVTEALARGRTVVATSFSARAVPAGAEGAVLVADDAPGMAAHVLHLWRDLAGRRAGEKALLDPSPVPTWAEACAPLTEAIEGLTTRR